MTKWFVFLALASFGFAQAPPGFGRIFLGELQAYLELTPEQVTSITRLNSALSQLNGTKSLRAAQVQAEILQETRKPTVDAMALGLRYVELEAIQRELRAEQEKTVAEIQKLFTPAQVTKLGVLREAMRLQPVICQAQANNILPAPAPGAIIPSSRMPGFADFLLAGIISPYPISAPCGLNLTGPIRTGDFGFEPGRP